MLLELGIPQGQVVSRWRGGEDVVRGVVDRLRSTSFTGYLKVSLSKEGERSEGLVSFNAGVPALCLYVFQPFGLEEIWFLGDQGGEYMLADALQSESVISLHADVEMKDYEKLFPQARIRRLEMPRIMPSREKLREDKLNSAGAESSSESLFKGLAGLPDQTVKRKAERQAEGVYDLILQYHKMSTDGFGMNTCKDCGGPLDLLGYCPRCAAKGDPARALTPRLDPRLTFETFSVGQNSRFAEAAARAITAEPGNQYNPLFIYGRTGLGKTHLLQAIGHRFKKDGRGKNVVYLPLESMDDAALASLGDKLGELGQEVERADLLLVDDLQYLSGKERLQEDLLRIVNGLVARGRQVVVTANRGPRDIPLMSERLVSHLESGLVLDITQPDKDTRINILKKEVTEEGLSIPDDVLAFVAEACPDDVRQLEGGLNRVIAFASLMRAEVTVDVAREVLGQKDGRPAAGRKVALAEHRSYLLEEARPDKSYGLVAAKLKEGYKGLIFTRSNPATVRSKLGNGPADIYWLTERESKEERTIPPSLEKIVLLVEEQLHKDGPCLIFLDDLHYLVSNATFDGVIRFVRSLIDMISEHRAIFVVSVSPDSLKVQERSVLEREMEPIAP